MLREAVRRSLEGVRCLYQAQSRRSPLVLFLLGRGSKKVPIVPYTQTFVHEGAFLAPYLDAEELSGVLPVSQVTEE